MSPAAIVTCFTMPLQPVRSTCSIFIALDYGDLLPAQHLVAFRDIDADDRALDRRDHARGALCPGTRPGLRSGRGSARRRLCGLGRLGRPVVGEQSERIDGVDAGAGEAAVTCVVGRLVHGVRRRAASARSRNEALPPAVAGGRRQFPGVVVEPAGVEVARGKVRVVEDALQPGDVRRGSADAKLVERPRDSLHGAREVARRRMGDHLRQQGVEGRVRLVAGVAAAVDPHARSARRFVGDEYAGGGAHGALGVQGFQVDPRLDREAARDGRPPALRARDRQAFRRPRFAVEPGPGRHR